VKKDSCLIIILEEVYLKILCLSRIYKQNDAAWGKYFRAGSGHKLEENQNKKIDKKKIDKLFL